MKNFLTKLYRFRFTMKKNDVSVLNVSIILFAIALIVQPWLVVITVSITFLAGYKIKFVRDSVDFQGEDCDSLLFAMKSTIKTWFNKNW